MRDTIGLLMTVKLPALTGGACGAPVCQSLKIFDIKEDFL